LPDGVEMLMPGEHATVRVAFMAPLPMHVGLPITVRDGTLQTTIARGVISRLLPSAILKKLSDADSIP
jgi:elongation factor Tu